MKKVLVVASIWPFYNFEKNDIQILQQLGYEVHCATNFDVVTNREVKINNVIKHQIDFSRSPFSKKTIKAFLQLRRLLKENNFSVVHCHTPVAGILTRIAAKKYRKKGMKVLYTSHGFHFYKGAPVKNWLLYYTIEKICAKFTDILITINQEDFELVNQKFKPQKSVRIPGVGIDSVRFQLSNFERDSYRKKIGIEKDEILILSVGEVNKNKNHQLVIKAVASLKNPKIKYYIAGIGDEIDNNKLLAKKLEIDKQVNFLGYRNDIPELNTCADIFAFPSIREGLGLAAIEALASGTPVVGMDTRGINEYVKDGSTGFKFENNVNSCVNAIKKLIEFKENNESITNQCISMSKDYDISKTNNIMEVLYNELL